MEVTTSINIGNVCKEAVPEVFQNALEKVLKNIDDTNTVAKQKRKIVLTFEFEPNESRELGEVTLKSEVKLAGLKAIKGNFFLSRSTRGDIRAYSRDPKQDELFAAQPVASPVKN